MNAKDNVNKLIKGAITMVYHALWLDTGKSALTMATAKGYADVWRYLLSRNYPLMYVVPCTYEKGCKHCGTK